MRVRVLRAFCIAGERQEPGTEIEVPDSIVRELVHMGKAERADGVAQAASFGPMTTVTAAAVVQGKKAAAKESADVPK
jgi:hypothetical protein